MPAIGQRRVSPGRQLSAEDIAFAFDGFRHRHGRLELQLVGHVDHVVLEEGRPARLDAAGRQPAEHLRKAIGDPGERLHGDQPAHGDVGLGRPVHDDRFTRHPITLPVGSTIYSFE